ncbi:MAG: hypothetical protein GWN58_11175 [Anaerolineae bacterium]|nr:hypothetical protein [Anaerolineae bacterium]
MAGLIEFLVGVEAPALHPEGERFIMVSESLSGFGPDLVVNPPVESVKAVSAADAAWEYAMKHGMEGCQAIVNLANEHSEWWMDTTGPEEMET